MVSEWKRRKEKMSRGIIYVEYLSRNEDLLLVQHRKHFFRSLSPSLFCRTHRNLIKDLSKNSVKNSRAISISINHEPEIFESSEVT